MRDPRRVAEEEETLPGLSAPVIAGIHIPLPLPPSSWELQAPAGFLQQEKPLQKGTSQQGILPGKCVIHVWTSEGVLSWLRLGSPGVSYNPLVVLPGGSRLESAPQKPGCQIQSNHWELCDLGQVTCPL